MGNAVLMAELDPCAAKEGQGREDKEGTGDCSE
jgi:hypothetical protein